MLEKISDIKSFLVDWNNTYPLDRIWRKKYNIAFCSKEHLDVSQIDVFLDLFEDKMFSHYLENHRLEKQRFDDYKKKGEIFHNFVVEEKVSQMFDDLDISSFNKK